jgi:hypothetical protein
MAVSMIGPMRWSAFAPRRDGFAIASALVALLLVAAAVTGTWYAARHASREQRMRDGAAILAEHGLREFAESARPLDMLALAVGDDSIVHKARVFGDDESGMFAVQVSRAHDLTFRVKATGRLASAGSPFVCSYDVSWDLAREGDPRTALQPHDEPLCNGEKRRRPADDHGLRERLGR